MSDTEKFRVGQEISKLGGLSFSVHSDGEGWYAQCNELPGIIAANKNPQPTDAEIEAEIRQAIISGLDVQTSPTPVTSPFGFSYKQVGITQ